MGRKFTKDDIDKLHDYDIHVSSRTVTIFSVHTGLDGSESGVDSSLAERVIKNLAILESINNEPINIILNTPGGCWYSGMAIFDAIAKCKSHVTIKGIGQVMSMGSVIMQAGDVRQLYPYARMMIHYGYSAWEGHSKTGEKIARECSFLDRQMEKIFLEKIKEKHPNFTLKRLQKMLDHDTYLSAREAVSLGLADSIVGEGDSDG